MLRLLPCPGCSSIPRLAYRKRMGPFTSIHYGLTVSFPASQYIIEWDWNHRGNRIRGIRIPTYGWCVRCRCGGSEYAVGCRTTSREVLGAWNRYAATHTSLEDITF
ncbi:hypothetical protein [Bifidobacterium oedipodis]|uniref:Uncharacterized protein n=1 Tax=Bifidobacterium oedipodis TaxID=2675322 RepID=A0A7Y0ERD4_9BIFI|nr:hypothetical protein [Bifidobacterium sp. DSM 109957]NMM93926.1 hypothetical protein [Bifidobacterium sp. DSM 109957]